MSFYESVYPVLCNGVHLTQNCILDDDTNRTIQLNNTSREILLRSDGRHNIEEIAEEIAQLFDVDVYMARTDILDFLNDANATFLVNFQYRNLWKNMGFIFFAVRWMLTKCRRYKVVRGNAFKCFSQALCLVSHTLGIFAAISILCIGVVIAIAGIYGDNAISSMMCRFLSYVIVFYIGLFSGIALHESIHIIHFHRKCLHRGQGFLSYQGKGFRIGFQREVIAEDIAIKASGGGITGLIGCLGIALTLLAVQNDYTLKLLMVFFSTYALHILNLLPFWGDGKEIFYALILKFMTPPHKK